MEQETIDLVRQLCCEVGMIMEDMNPVALATPQNPDELREVIRQLSGAVIKMGTIVAAAAALLS